MQVVRVGCVTDAQNHRSVAVARRLGMNLVGQEAVRGEGVRDAAALILQVDRNTWLARHRD
jgi:RimJ/RimL family protein N-acetyltransferase